MVRIAYFFAKTATGRYVSNTPGAAVCVVVVHIACLLALAPVFNNDGLARIHWRFRFTPLVLHCSVFWLLHANSMSRYPSPFVVHVTLL